MPFFRTRCASMQFIDISSSDHQRTILSFYETGNVPTAVDPYEWSNRHTVKKYFDMYSEGVGV